MRKAQHIEWPTLGLMIGCYALWGVATWFASDLGLWLAIPLITLSITLHSSLQHETLHGHPLPRQWMSDALVFPAIGLFIPYQRFRDTHLAHHRNELLTDPYDDPESNFLDPKVWESLPTGARRILTVNNTLIGRMLIGPLIGTALFYRTDAALIRQGDKSVLRGWAMHALGLLPVMIWLSWASVPVWAYLVAAYLGLSILKIRTFLEHRADERAAGRSVIIEDRGPLALLFLNNNFHAVHHAHPQVSWYALPALYRQRRDVFLQRNGGYLYRSYLQVFAAYLFRAKDPVPHPLMDREVNASGPCASLPMYDRPELRTETDTLWAALRDAIRARGINAPDALDRRREVGDIWRDPALVLSQTCGMPWRLGLHCEAALIGTPDYGIEGCAPGYYCSVIVVRADDPREALADFAEATCAYNSKDSQSGYAALGGARFGRWLETGGHAASIAAVAEGAADIAAVDAVTWRLSQRFQAEARKIRVLMRTEPTPGLPYITALANDDALLADAAEEAIAALDSGVRDALGLIGFVRIPSADYLAVA